MRLVWSVFSCSDYVHNCICYTVFFLGKPIFSIDIHPDGSRFATGGQGKRSWIILQINCCIIGGILTWS